MSAADDQAKFFAREFVARIERELGAAMAPDVRRQALFAAEIGYLRGRTDGMQAAMELFGEKDRT